MTYLYQAIKARISDWLATAWKALKAKAIATLQKLRARNTGDR